MTLGYIALGQTDMVSALGRANKLPTLKVRFEVNPCHDPEGIHS